jgi:formiminoglutamase
MSGGSSNAGAWFTQLKAADVPKIESLPDDLRVGDIIETWQGDPAALRAGRSVLVGFPQDEGVRRNHGRPGAAEAPTEIRRWLYRLCAADPESGFSLVANPPLDLGDVPITGSLEDTQDALAQIVAAILKSGATPVVLGGGHETAFGHYLGYVRARKSVGIINIDAHLDVRPPQAGLGHSGSPFRQAIEHPSSPLPGDRYVCLGAQPQSVSVAHARFAQNHGCVIRWCGDVSGRLVDAFAKERDRLSGCSLYLTLDADAVRAADVPGVSAPNSLGLAGNEVAQLARYAGACPVVASIDLVEINPRHDRDGRSARWAAVVIWNFLIGRLTLVHQVSS